MQSLFWALGEDWWKQIIDGCFHLFGPEVFDKGLHRGPVEPGFLSSLKSGMYYASDHLGQPLTLDFFKTLHQKLCVHFKGSATDTEMDASRAGQYREKGVCSVFSLEQSFGQGIFYHYCLVDFHGELARSREPARVVLQEWIDKLTLLYPQRYCHAQYFIQQMHSKKDIPCFVEQALGLSLRWISLWEKMWKKRVHQLNQYTQELADTLGCPRFVSFSSTQVPRREGPPTPCIQVNYLPLDPTQLETLIKTLFTSLNHRLSAHPALPRHERLREIARLYQLLEWLHPFEDGQGRTNLVLLSKLLTEQGFHPVILETPYFCDVSTLDEWVGVLEKGLVAWEQLARKPESKPQMMKPRL